MINDEHLLTTADAARRLGIAVPTLNRWARAGRIAPAIEGPGIRGARMYAAADIEALAQERAS